MATISLSDLSEESRHEIIAEGIVDNPPVIPGVTCVRGITPLVLCALQRANNPFATNRKGFEAIGIQFDESGNQMTDAAEFALAIMPKTAEVLVLLSCTREELKQFAVNAPKLQDCALDLMDASSMEDLGKGTVFVSEQLQLIARSRAVKSEDDEKPQASTLEGASPRKKKPGHRG